ncbi:MAG TPA: hypothetical protein VFA03_13600 [Acetobacteraceae bacterium]|nr:hypothetical protein [Acetobacteraceae bacterium]
MTRARYICRLTAGRLIIPDDPYAYIQTPTTRGSRTLPREAAPIAVTDDWPEVVPITDTELRVIEGHFAEDPDDIFGPRA